MAREAPTTTIITMNPLASFDLTEAVEAGARGAYDEYRDRLIGHSERNGELPTWDELSAVVRHNWLENVIAIVDAAAPVLIEQARHTGATADLARWLVSLDDDDPDSPGGLERRTVTMTRIINRARLSLL